MPNLLNRAPEPATELGRYRILSTTSSLRVSPLALGALSIGDKWNDVMGHMDKEAAFRLLDGYVAAGGNFIDTSNNYQDEQSEEWLGEWMAARQNRDRVVIATKFSLDYRSYAVGKNVNPNNAGNGRRSMRQSLKASLRKLQTDFVDILYVHYWDYSTSIAEVMDTLHALVQSGQVLYLGVSNTPAWLVSAANTYAEAHGRTPFSIYQGRWNVMIRDMERDILPMARHFGMALAPWDVLGGGKLQSKAAMARRAAAGEGLRTLYDKDPSAPAAGQQTDEEARFSEVLVQVAAEHGLTSVTAVALAYVLAKAPRVFPILGGRKLEHWQDNIRALSIRLTPAQIAAIEGVKPFDPGFPNNFSGVDPVISGVATELVALGAVVDYSQPLVRRT